MKIRSFVRGVLAIATAMAGFSLAEDSVQAAGPLVYPVTATYVYATAANKNSRGTEGYVAVWMTDHPANLSGLKTIVLCSSGATSADCEVTVNYTRDQLLTWLSVIQGAIYHKGRLVPDFGNCKGAFANGCPKSFQATY